jgi:hypothetical protein
MALLKEESLCWQFSKGKRGKESEREGKREGEGKGKRSVQESPNSLFRILKDYTNRHMDSALKEVMIRFLVESQVNALIYHNPENRDKEVTDLFLSTHVCFLW